MKKTLLALTVAAFAASSANAVNLIDSKETGTKIDFTGSLRLMYMDQEHGDRGPVKNNGSRFGFNVKQELGLDFYALGGVQWRMRGGDKHDFDDVYTRNLYAGIGNKYLGELTYGHQAVITDEVKQTDLANTLSLSDGLLIGSARKSLQYVYKGVDGLKVGAFYGDSSRYNMSASKMGTPRKDVWGLGATYNWKITDHNSFKVGLGTTYERMDNGQKANAYSLGMAYTLFNTTLGLDLEGKDTETLNGVVGAKRTQREVRSIIYQRLTSDWNAYGMYAHKTNKVTKNIKTNQFMVGTEYWLARDFLKQYGLSSKAFVEWQSSKTDNSKRSNTTLAGFRVFW
jgi:predicted porin